MAIISGTPGNDNLTGTTDADTIDGLAGNDIIHGGGGNDTLTGGPGDDQLFGDDGDDALTDSDSGNDLLDGGAGNDRLFLYRLDQQLHESATLIGGAGNDTITSWSYATGDVTIDAGSGDDLVTLFSSTNSHRITLGPGQDILDLGRFQPWAIDTTTREVTDFAPGRGGDTILLYDLLSGYGTWDGQANPFELGILQLEQRGGDTVLKILLDDQTKATHDLLILRGVTLGTLVAENFGGLSPNGFAATPLEFVGGAGPDTLTGGYGNDLISGGDGNDFLTGLAGDDRIDGGPGNDYIVPGYGNDTVSAGAGNDIIDLTHDGGSDTIDAGSGDDTVNVYRNFRDVFERLSIVTGAGDDLVTFQLFDAGRTVVDLGVGNDRFVLLGTRHDLTITFGDGADILDLSRHYVSTIGQEIVTLTDFKPGEDRIVWGNWLKSELIGWDWHADAFAGGFLRLQEEAGQLVLLVDRDGPGHTYAEARFLIFQGLSAGALHDSDFLLFTPRPASDINGDGRSDVVLANSNGSVTDWLGQADGTFFSNHQAASYVLPAGWRIAGTGDVNGDGRADAILRNSNGSITEWLGQAGGGFAWNSAASYALPTAWHLAGVGDFNGDGRADLLLRHDNGAVTDWLGQADGTFFSNHAAASYALPAGWTTSAVGDFNGDGRADVLLRNSDGSITEWLGLPGGTFGWNGVATYGLNPLWTVAGAADVNGDGRADLVLRHANGTVIDWLANPDGTFTSNHANATYALDSAWKIAAFGDYNGDGFADVLLRQDSGAITEWLGTANGGFQWNAAAIYALGSAWSPQPLLAA